MRGRSGGRMAAGRGRRERAVLQEKRRGGEGKAEGKSGRAPGSPCPTSCSYPYAALGLALSCAAILSANVYPYSMHLQEGRGRKGSGLLVQGRAAERVERRQHGSSARAPAPAESGTLATHAPSSAPPRAVHTAGPPRRPHGSRGSVSAAVTCPAPPPPRSCCPSSAAPLPPLPTAS